MPEFYFLVDAFKELHKKKKIEILSRSDKLTQELSRLSEASDTVKLLEDKISIESNYNGNRRS